MARTEKYRVTFNLSEKEIQKFLEAHGLMECFKELSSRSKIETIYLSLKESEKVENLPRTMKNRQRGEYKSEYKDFGEFKKVFDNYLMRSIVYEHISEQFKNPSNSQETITQKVLEKQENIFERALSVAYSELLNDINLRLIEFGYQPFDMI